MHGTRTSYGLAAGALLAGGALCACGAARPVVAQAPPASSAGTTTAVQRSAAARPCRPAGAGFAVSVPPTEPGADSPVGAAETFQTTTILGYGAPATDWAVQSAPVEGAATLTDGTTQLRAVRRGDGSWVVVSGARCG